MATPARHLQCMRGKINAGSNEAPTTCDATPFGADDMKVAKVTGYASGSDITFDAPLYGAKEEGGKPCVYDIP